MAAYVGPNIDSLKRYGGVLPDGDVETLALCMSAAKIWFANAGVSEPIEENDLYNLGVYRLALHYYDNRGELGGAQEGEVPFGVMSIMHQLRL